MDFLKFKISNRFILISLILGILLFLLEKNWTSLFRGSLAAIVPIIMLIPLFALGVLGAGDIKLFSVIGLIKGLTFLLHTMLISLFVAGILSIIFLIKTKGFQTRLSYLSSYIKVISNQTKQSGKLKLLPYYDIQKNGHAATIHYSIAILVGAIIQLIK